jgi:Kef-type K+ transport system membrane component KefB
VQEIGFDETAIILLVAAVAGAVAIRLRQPLIVAFIAIGIAFGPIGFDWVGEGGAVDLLAEIGIAVLLFLVGLRLDVRMVRTMGPVALVTGLGQIAFTSIVGFFLGLALGLEVTPAAYVAVALTFSSTIIIVKLLSDKRELDDLHGRIAVGFLIVQDIAVIVVMIVLTGIGGSDGGGEGGNVAVELVAMLGKATLFLAAIYVLARWVLPRVLHGLARSSELLILSAIAWAVAVAAASSAIGLSAEVGAFLAGVSLAGTAYREAIGARLTSLRDFLLLFFFVGLGASLELGQAGDQLVVAAVLSAFVLIGNPLIVMVIMGLMRYPARVAFLAGLTVAQISEFSLILAALGLRLGQIDDEVVSLITLVGIITIGLSTYLILYSHQLYDRFAPWLAVFERAKPKGDPRDPDEEERNVGAIVFGAGRHGGAIVDALADAGVRVLVVDHDPYAPRWEETDLVTTVYGDAEEPELMRSLPLASAPWVVGAIPRLEVGLVLLHGLEHAGYDGRVLLTAHRRDDEERLRQAGADAVVIPFDDAATRIAGIVTDAAT